MYRLAAAVAVLMILAVIIAGVLREAPTKQAYSTATAFSASTAGPDTPSTEQVTANLQTAGHAQDCSAVYRSQIDSIYDELTAERADRIIEEARTTYRESGEIYLQVFAAMLIDDPGERIDLYASAIDAGQTSPFFLWSAVNACLMQFGKIDCPAQDWLDRLLAVDSENSEVWIRSAYLHKLAGRHTQALEALQRAAIAYESNSYWLESVESARAGIDAIGGYSQATAAINAIGFAAAYPSFDHQLVALCSKEADIDRAWADACRAYGEHVVANNRALSGESMGRAILADALVALGEPEDSERIESVRQLPAVARDDELLRYPDSFRIFYDSFRRDGEVAAVEAVRDYNSMVEASGRSADCGDIRVD